MPGGVDADDGAAECSTTWSTAWCSAAGHTARPRLIAPTMAALSALGAAAGEDDLARAHADDSATRRGPRRRLAGRRGRSGATRSGWRSAR